MIRSHRIAIAEKKMMTRKSTFRYDEKGNIVEQMRVAFWSTVKYVYVYEYDQHGNWIKETILIHTSDQSLTDANKQDEYDRRIVTTRKITYY